MNKASCPICLEKYKDGCIHEIVLLKCGHYFDKKCITRWLDVNKKCPICRKKVANLKLIDNTCDFCERKLKNSTAYTTLTSCNHVFCDCCYSGALILSNYCPICETAINSEYGNFYIRPICNIM